MWPRGKWGLGAARRLAGRGASARVVAAAADDYTGIPAHHLALLRRMDCPLDAEMADRIQRVIWHGAPVLSLDLPSGLGAPAARSAVGDLHLADIGIPPFLYDELGVSGDVTGLFDGRDLVPLR